MPTTKTRLSLLAAAILAVAAATTSASALAATSAPFDATFVGTFAVASTPGGSDPLFAVHESGSGDEQRLGTFEYTTALKQNFARPPEGCGPFSSTGVGGSAVLTFPEGQIRLHRSASATCFSFPLIENTDRWVIGGGSGRFRGASGTLTRTFTGNETTGGSTGTFSGTLRLR